MLRVDQEGVECVLYSATDVSAELALLFAECGRRDIATQGWHCLTGGLHVLRSTPMTHEQRPFGPGVKFS